MMKLKIEKIKQKINLYIKNSKKYKINPNY